MILKIKGTKLVEAVTAYRKALESSRFTGYPVLGNFPFEACDVASLLLATYLTSMGFGQFECVKGRRRRRDRGRIRFHVWLEQNHTIIDITADQFQDGMGAVVVTNDRSWHDTFIQQTRWKNFVDFESDPENFKSIYDEIVAEIGAVPPRAPGPVGRG